MASRFNTNKPRDDSEDFPLLVDEDDDFFHDSYQVSEMERGGDDAGSSSLLDMLNQSYQGPSVNNQMNRFNEQQLFSPFRSTVPQHPRRDDLEDLYSFSMSDEDDVMLDFNTDDKEGQEQQSYDGSTDLWMDSNTKNKESRHYSDNQATVCFDSVNNLPASNTIKNNEMRAHRPYFGKNASHYYPASQQQLFFAAEALASLGDNSDLAPLDGDQRRKVIRFADDEPSEQQSSTLFRDSVFVSERSMTIVDIQDKHLDIFDQGSSSIDRGSAPRSSSLLEDMDDCMSEGDTHFEDDDDDDEEELERRIYRSLMYNGATIAVVAGLGYVSKKVMSAFSNKDEVDGVQGIDDAANETGNVVADAAQTVVDAGIEAGGSVTRGAVSNGEGGGGSQGNTNTQQQ